MTQPILIAGATGGVGQHLVGKLTVQDQDVRALVRNLAQAQKLFAPQDCLQLVEGSTSQTITLPNAVIGVRAVICTIGARAPAGEDSPEKVDYEGVRNLIMAARNASIGRFILVSSLGVTHPEHPLNNFGRILDWKLKGENVLRTSGLNYTIIRPGGLTDESGGKTALRIEQGDTLGGGRISRSDVAAVCLAALDDIATFYTTFEVVAQEDAPPNDLSALFANLKTDRELGWNG
ncbi:MAG: NAD(P)H-binding protein [Chloroflexi bacterium]|nr:NAD(P)H-binding protein [Chloroflexota bacterium]